MSFKVKMCHKYRDCDRLVHVFVANKLDVSIFVVVNLSFDFTLKFSFALIRRELNGPH